jgi:hypothetical protein
MSKPKNKTITIEVTVEDIEQAIPADSGHCAISDAISRQIPGASKVSTDLQTIRWSDREKGVRYVYLTPRVAQALLLDFDQGEREYCQPLTFRLTTPAQIIPITTKKNAPSSRAERDAARVKRETIRAQIETKIAAGEALTSDEKRRVAAYKTNDAKAAQRAAAAPERPTRTGPRVVVGVDTTTDEAFVEGGQAPLLGALAHGQGRVRRFGVKAAGSPKSATP